MIQRLSDSFDQHTNRPRPGFRLLVGILVVIVIGFAVHTTIASPDQSTVGATNSPLVVGAVPYWDQDEARSSLETRSNHINVASPWSYAVATGGAVQLQPELKAGGEQALTARLHELGIKVIPTVANTTAGLWDSATVSTVINNPDLRGTHVQSILTMATSRAGRDAIVHVVQTTVRAIAHIRTHWALSLSPTKPPQADHTADAHRR